MASYKNGRYEAVYTNNDPRDTDDIIVYQDGLKVRSFNSISCDYAWTNAREYVDQRAEDEN